MRIIVITLTLLLLFSGIAWTNSAAQAVADARAQELLKQARAALGGEEKLKTVQSLSAAGKFRRSISGRDLSGELEFDLLLPDNYLKTETMIPVPSVSIISTDLVNGEQVVLDVHTSGPGNIQYNRPGTGNASPEAKAAAQRVAREEYARLFITWLLTAPSSFPVEFKYAGVVEDADGRADVLELKGPGGFASHLLLNQKTHLPMMLGYSGPAPRGAIQTGNGSESQASLAKKIGDQLAMVRPGEVPMQFRFSDYRDVDGILFPHRITKVTDGTVSEEWQMSKYKLNPALKPDKFGKNEKQESDKDTTDVESIRHQFINEPAKDFQLSSIEGRAFRLSELKGKVVLVNFWATWCVGCVKEMPFLVNLYQKYRDRGLEILAISVDSQADRNKVAPFAKEQKINFPVFYDDGVQELYDIAAFPSNLFIDRQGRVRLRLGGFRDGQGLDAIINELLKAA